MISEVKIKAVQDYIQNIGRNKIIHSANEAEHFETLYREIFNEGLCTTCPGTLANAIERVINLSTIQIKNMADRKYKMGPGIIDTVYSPIEGVPVHVTNANLTDEVAEKLLKANPNYKNQIFKVAGEDAKAVKEPKAEKLSLEEVMTMNKSEIIDKLKEADIPYETGSTKEDLAKLLVKGK